MAKRLGLNIDDRTDQLSDEALYCRTFGHLWVQRGIGRKRFQELIVKGHAEYNRYCNNGCGSTWRQLWDVYTGEVLENERKYPRGDYLLKANSGRLKRTAARVAHFARMNPGYA